jgi:hypothetical protein
MFIVCLTVVASVTHAASVASAGSFTLSGATLQVTGGFPWHQPDTDYAYRILGVDTDLVGTNAEGAADRSGMQWIDGQALPHIMVSGRVSEINLSMTDWSHAGWFDLGIIGENHIAEAWDHADSLRSHAFNSSGYMLLMTSPNGSYTASVQDKAAGPRTGNFDLGNVPGYFDFQLQIETQQGDAGQGRLRVNQNGAGWSDWGAWLDFGQDGWKSDDDWSKVTLIAQLFTDQEVTETSSVTISDITVTVTPEPTTLSMLVLAGLFLAGRKPPHGKHAAG